MQLDCRRILHLLTFIFLALNASAFATDKIAELDCNAFKTLTPEAFDQSFEDGSAPAQAFKEFLASGGKGTIFALTLPPQHPLRSAWRQSFFIAITALPQNPSPNSPSVFFHDSRLLKRSQKLLSQGEALLFGFSTAVKGETHCAGDPIMKAISACFFAGKPRDMLILTQSADYYALIHEEKHLDDCRTGLRNDVLADIAKLKINNVAKNILELYVLEQRAYATQMSLIENDKSGPEKAYMISPLPDNAKIWEISLAGYARAEIPKLKNSFNWSYANPMESLRAEGNNEFTTQLDALLRKYALPMPGSELEDLLNKSFNDRFGGRTGP